jgi:glutamate-ammonia-ligase adenylyltransferase
MDDDLDGELLAAVGLGEDDDSRSALAEIGSTPVPLDLLRRLRSRLDVLLPKSADPAFVLRSLQRFIAASRSPTALLALFERDDRALATLLRVLGAGQRLTSWLVAEPESFDLVRASDGAEASKETLVDEIVAELESLSAYGNDEQAATRVLRSVFARERLRIAYADFVGQATPARVAAQLTVLADAIIESAVQYVRGGLILQYGQPRTPDGQPGRFAIIGLGPLGGNELSYDSPLDLIFLRDLCEPTDGQVNLPAEEFFDLLAERVLELLSHRESPVFDEPIYEVSASHRPLTDQGSIALTVTEAHRHYQLMGRTWERLLYVKSRCVAGDLSLGNEFLTLMEPWVFRRYLERADIEGLHTLARKFSRRVEEPTSDEGSHVNASQLDVLTCPGGLDDIDSVIGLLQLINGGDLPELRVRSTLDAIGALRRSDCLSLQEATLLTDHYGLLTRYLHCVQAEKPSKDLSRNDKSAAADEVADHRRRARIAWHLGFRDVKQGEGHTKGDVSRLDDAIETATRLNRTIIRHLLHDAAEDSDPVPIETELVLDPEPEETIIRETMLRHRLVDPLLAMHDLQRLADEPVPFLSSRRCRHFLATIAPQLLAEISRTPDPHATLSTLVEVSDSLGGKAVLWELFRAAPPTMRLVVRLCACSPYLSRILIRNPGMIDELVDSLLLDRLPTESWLEASSNELCRGAVDVDPIVASFKKGAHLQIGVRDVLGKESLEATHAALASTAECVLRRISEHAMRGLTERYGDPVTADGEPIEFVMLGLGKLGAREPNYFSDLDAIFLYTGDGSTQRRVGGHRTTTTASHFFTELTRAIINRVNQPVDGTRLYELATSIAIGGNSSGPAIPANSVQAFGNYFRRGEAAIWQRLSLCKARAISGSPAARERVNKLIVDLLASTEWYPLMATQIRDLRLTLEQSSTDDNLKRAAGGTVDVEWLTQTLQLCHASKHPDLLVPGTTDALQKISDAGLIDAAVAAALISNYRTLREVESKLCLLATPRRHEIPEDPKTLELLAFLMSQSDGSEIMARCRECRASNRRLFNQVFQELAH